MTARPFRFGINVFNATSRQEWQSKARKAEDLGYSSFLVADHLWVFPPIVGLMEAAEATTRLRVGSYVFANDFRHPILLAREAAAIDMMSNGRLEFGLGTGYHVRDYQPGGFKLDTPSVRVSRFEEAVQIIKGVWADKPYTFTGKHYSIHEVECIPKPVQTPHPPFLIGGGSKRLLSIAAREADIVGINFRTTAQGGFDIPSFSIEATLEKIEWVRQAAGARFNELELSILIPFAAITDDPQSSAEKIASQFRHGGFDLQSEHVLATPHALIGSVDQIVNDLQERRERYGVSYIVIREGQFDEFAPVVTRLTGT